MKQKEIYINAETGKINKLETFISNHDWIMPLAVLIGLILLELIERL